MSGLQHFLGNDFYDTGTGDNKQRHDVVWPAVTENDRDVILLCAEHAGFDRGNLDGLSSARRRKSNINVTMTFAIPPAHVLLHLQAWLRNCAETVKPTGLSVDRLRAAWLAGYARGIAVEGEMRPFFQQ